jgi:drug/metabolite transporter (DMT)-like permease
MTSAVPARAAPALSSASREALLAVVVVLLLWTSNVIWVREAGDDVLGFTTWRMILAIPVLGVIALGTLRGPARVAPPTAVHRHDTTVIRLAMVGIGALFGLSAYLNFVSLNETTLVNVGVIHSLQPAIVAIVAGRYLGELVDWRLTARASVAILGAVLVAAASAGEGSWSLYGDVLAVIGLFLNSAWFVAGRWIRTRTTIDATSYMLVVFATSAAVMTAIAAASGHGLGVTWHIAWLALFTAVAGTIGHTVMAWAHRFVPAAVSSLFLLSQPVLIALLAWAMFDEALAPLHFVGGAIVLGALAGIVTHRTAEPSPEGAGLDPDARDETDEHPVI